MLEISSPPVQYTGSKWRIAPWIIQNFPIHTGYCEPFCGAAGVFFRKPPSSIETINDLNGEVINFFDVLRTRTDALVNAIDLTPWSRFEIMRALTPSEDPLERARRFYIRAYQSYTAGEADDFRGWAIAVNGGPRLRQWGRLNHLYACAQRLKMAQIEHDTAINVIKRFDDEQTLFYCDPPYVSEARYAGLRDYPLEMTDSDHESLAESLHSIKGMAIISGYDCPLYERLYGDWQKVSIEARTVNNVKRRETLWINPAAQARQMQKRLF